MLMTYRSRKGPWGWGMGLRVNVAGRAQECLWPWRAEDQVRDTSRLPGPELVGETLSAFPLIL